MLHPAPTIDPARYYADVTAQYARYAGAARGWHHGVWEPDVRGHVESLLRSNEMLLRGLDIGPTTELLDVGCGVGGFAVWAARRFGCRVTGITLCTEHPALAAALAAEHGVAERCRFLAMDMDRLALRDERFDVVVNQETFCHASEKARYLAAVFRVLRPGGAWRAVDFSVQEATLSPAAERARGAVCAGFHIASLAPASEVERFLAAAGFEDVATRDVTAETVPSADLILGKCRGPRWLMQLGLDWIIFSRHPRRRANRRGHVLAAQAYGTGLKRGYFRHLFYAATRPAQGRMPA